MCTRGMGCADKYNQDRHIFLHPHHEQIIYIQYRHLHVYKRDPRMM